MDDLLQKIQMLGLNQYETKAYVTLVRQGASSAYQVSKNSGVPRARIYEILNDLEQKGVVMKEEINEAVQYSPLPVDVFLEAVKEKWEETYAYVEKNLKGFEREEPEVDPRVTTLKGEENILAFCRILIRRAQKKVILSMWNPMYEKLLNDLQAKQEECSLKGIVFQVEEPLPELEVHRQTSYVDNIGNHKWFILSIDGKEMVYGHSIEQKGNAFYTDDPVHVYLLENYIWHDILVNRLVKDNEQNIDSWIAPERDKFFKI
ncbi:helix-turn-helix domain-containing protein [Bacillus sp. DX4.1]|uniref:TrmB family transcriptional regulator n=1 Tax=Bacillus sp. DX4.1 TaxID=3055867 RepID=UPI0025A173DE|nr:TrmB family transcriptional regulator [Bacillus sp. DX4.1]MDM5188208.1 helix-turn-helix domain-containing protein [Bacillus sp. DX4.1]